MYRDIYFYEIPMIARNKNSNLKVKYFTVLYLL